MQLQRGHPKQKQGKLPPLNDAYVFAVANDALSKVEGGAESGI